MPKAIDITEYIIRNIAVDPLKLQKLLFYTQAVTLVRTGRPAFDDPIEAWDYGPVVRSIYKTYNKFGFDILKPQSKQSKPIDEETRKCIDMVNEFYGQKSGPALINETHSEDPWKNAYKRGQSTVITNDEIQQYYSKIFSFD